MEKRGVITSEISKQAASQSNIDEMAKQMQEQEEAQIQAEAQAQQEQPQQGQVPVPAEGEAPAPAPPRPSGDRPMKMKAIAMVLKLLDQKRAEEVLSLKILPMSSGDWQKPLDLKNRSI